MYAAHYTKAAELSRLWPTIQLSAVLGRGQAGPLGFSKISTFGLSVFQPLLDLVKIQSDVKAKKARVEQKIQDYMKTVLQAYEEVENALSSYQSQQKQSVEAATLVHVHKRLWEQSRALYQQGLNSKVEVNTQEIQWLDARQNQDIMAAALIKSMLQVIKAAGY